MFYAISAHSEEVDTDLAIEEIMDQCNEKLEGRTPKAGLLFASIDMEHEELVGAINKAWPGIQLIGCSTDGELSSEYGFCEDSVALMLFSSEHIDMTAGIGLNMSKNIPQACKNARDAALSKTGQKPAFCIITPDSLTASGHEIVKSLKLSLGDEISFFGGTAGDQWRFKGTYQYFCDEVLTDSLPLLLFSGDLLFSAGVSSGWRPVGSPGVITRSQGPIVHEIDNIPAIEFYRRYLGEDATPGGEFPLAILNDKDEMLYLRATGGFVDEDSGAITYFADMPNDTKVQITVADRDGIIEGCQNSIEMALKNYPEGKTPDVGIIFSCSARKLLLGTRTKDEHSLLVEKLGGDTELIGFYGYGEIGPSLSDKDKTEFHNETFISLLIGTK